MPKLLTFWSALDQRRRVIAVLAALAILTTGVVLARFASAPTYALLYAGLDPRAAGEIVTVLEQRGARHQIRGDAIWVEQTERDGLRMALAGEGLPAHGGYGYELLDQMTGFGTTAQMFDATHLRAKEGELARTLTASTFIRQARVHLAVPSNQTFRRDQKVTASVTITSATGGITSAQAQAVRHLISAAVTGLTPQDVAVIDTVTGLLPNPATHPEGAGEDRSTELKSAIERLLAARVGVGKALVELSMELITERESMTERIFDPQGRVMIASESEERSNSSNGSPPGVTVASNLPEGEDAPGPSTTSQGTETRERANYEVSETAREVLRPPGGVKRLSVAVLVDGLWAEDGSWTPRSEEEINDLRELVASAIGFSAERGDMLTIKSLQFSLPPAPEMAPIAGFLQKLDPMRLIQIGVIALVALAFMAFVLRPLLRARQDTPPSSEPLSLPQPELAQTSGVLLEADEADLTATPPIERLRRMISDRQVETVEILRSWMDDKEEKKP